MKYIYALLLLLWSITGFAQTSANNPAKNPNYDANLAAKLAGDDFGMKAYFLVVLKTGSNTSTDKVFVDESFRGHMQNINKLVKDGKLVVAGPLAKNEKSYRGIFIFNNVKDEVELKALLKEDLAIKNELLAYDYFTWYGSAALPEYLPFSDKIWKSQP